nr:hypothetical protein [Tanacetum cinerariifolium]
NSRSTVDSGTPSFFLMRLALADGVFPFRFFADDQLRTDEPHRLQHHADSGRILDGAEGEELGAARGEAGLLQVLIELLGRTACLLRSANICWLRLRPSSIKNRTGILSWPSSGFSPRPSGLDAPDAWEGVDMIDEFEDLQEEQEFDVELLGNFGRFVSSGSYPVEYFMASMPMAQAYKYLKFARDVQMDDINFDLLMQRDIDENRVEKEIMPYLQQDGATAATRPLFFPPLLAAIVPVKDEKIQEYYGVRSRITPKPNFVGVSWAGHFQLYGKLTSSSEGLALQSDQPEEKIKSKQAILKLRTSELDPHGVMLIVIDGQHRLRALKRLWQEHRDKVRDLVVPVCVMYAPNSHSDNSGKQNIPSVPRVFRNLFVDVNSTMTVVWQRRTGLRRMEYKNAKPVLQRDKSPLSYQYRCAAAGA